MTETDIWARFREARSREKGALIQGVTRGRGIFRGSPIESPRGHWHYKPNGCL